MLFGCSVGSTSLVTVMGIETSSIPPDDYFILMEDSGYILLEDDSKIVLE